MNLLSTVLIALGVLWGLQGFAGELIQERCPPVVGQGKDQPDQVRIEPESVYCLELLGVPEKERARVSGKYFVNKEGKIRLYKVGQIKLGGMAIREAEEAIEDHFKKDGIYPDPRVLLKPDKKR